MPQIQANVDLFPFNTFKVHAVAKSFCRVKSFDDLIVATTVRDPQDLQSYMTLGEGANVLFTKDFLGLIIKNEISELKVVRETDTEVEVHVGAGNNWHELVMWSVERGLSGIENLAYIPGTVGAAPAMNIAAYGQSVGEVVESVEGYHLSNLGALSTLRASECRFYYRDSIFKHELKNKFIITGVNLRLSKTPKYDLNYHGSKAYESLQGELDKVAPGESHYTPAQVAQAVINIRKIKMPDWHVVGTAGSFFKNPFVSKEKFAELQKDIPDLQAYPVDRMLYPNPDDPIFKLSDQVKIPAGKLLEKLGWRGKQIGRVATHDKHALIIINLGSATGQEILEFSKLIQEDIKKNYEIDLEPEVNII